MTKAINEERMVIILELEREGGTAPVTVKARGDYTITSDDLTVTRSLDDVILTPQEENAIKNFAGNVLNQIKTAEGI